MRYNEIMGIRPPPQLPVLIIQHAPHEHPAALRRALESQALKTQIVKTFEGQKLPNPNEISGLISLGGPMGANDEIDFPWLLDELRLMKRCFDQQVPIAGICLGGQLLARTLGGKVQANEHPEIGWFEIQVNAEGQKDQMMGGLGERPKFYQWHYDTFFPPKEATLLAGSKICPRQAFKIGEKTYGVQFHPEADHQLVNEWLGIEGTDEEILLARCAHHQICVQTPQEHLDHAREGELSSLSFVASLSQLFQIDPFHSSKTLSRDECQNWIQKKSTVILYFYGHGQDLIPIQGIIERVIEIPKGEFLFLREATGLVWPVRLDHVERIEPV